MADERIIVSRNKLEAIVAALKEKTGEEDGYTLDQMPDAIRAISSGGGGYALSNVSGVSLTKETDDVTIVWDDPDDIIVDDEPLAEWEGTIVVRKEGAPPESTDDGDIVVNNKERDQYSVNGFIDEDIDVFKVYFYRFFPYSKTNVFTRGTIKPLMPQAISWSTASDAEIVMAVQLADAGYIDLAEDFGWQVGDERVIHLAASVGVDDISVVACDMSFVLMNKGGYELARATVGGKTECSFVVGTKKLLYNAMLQDASGIVKSWGDRGVRDYLNNGFKDSMPSSILPIFKQVKVISTDTSNVNRQTEDVFFLPAEKEVFGVQRYGKTAEAQVLEQWTYFETPANRKRPNVLSGDSNQIWWCRTIANDGTYYIAANYDGTVAGYGPSNTQCVGPVGCI